MDVLLLGLFVGRRAIPRLSVSARAFLLAAGALVTAMTVVDMETMRFTGNHLTLSLAAANANGAALRGTLAILRSDPRGPYGGVLMLVMASVLWIGGRLRAWWPRGQRPPEVSARRLAAAVATMALTVPAAAWLAPDLGSRAWRMAPALVVASREWRERRAAELPAAERARFTELYRRDWREGADPGDARRWVFPRADYPFFRTTREEACREGAAVSAGECAADGDGDGFALREDCDDGDRLTHPDARDLPGDGVDQDCSGLDEDPWNVILIILESERAASVGPLAPGGARVRHVTPVLDALAAGGTSYTRVWTNGLPSTAAFMAPAEVPGTPSILSQVSSRSPSSTPQVKGPWCAARLRGTKSRSNLTTRFLAEFILRRNYKILHFVQNDKQRARNDKELKGTLRKYLF